jgi:hypothetical protein
MSLFLINQRTCETDKSFADSQAGMWEYGNPTMIRKYIQMGKQRRSPFHNTPVNRRPPNNTYAIVHTSKRLKTLICPNQV